MRNIFRLNRENKAIKTRTNRNLNLFIFSLKKENQEIKHNIIKNITEKNIISNQ